MRLFNNPLGSYYILSQLYVKRIVSAFNALGANHRKLHEVVWIEAAREALLEWGWRFDAVDHKSPKVHSKRAREFA